MARPVRFRSRDGGPSTHHALTGLDVHDIRLRMVGIGRPIRDVILGLIAPNRPSRTRTARKKLQAFSETAPLDQVVLFIRLVAVLALLGGDDVLSRAPGGEGVLSFGKPVATATEEMEVAGVPQDLELLANLRSYVVVVRERSRQLPLEGVYRCEIELVQPDALDTLHDLQKPASRVADALLHKPKLVPFPKNLGTFADEAPPDDRNLARGRYSIQEYVRPHPASTSGSGRERLSLFDGMRREEEFRNNPEVLDRPLL
jgi:hypothetical protein